MSRVYGPQEATWQDAATALGAWERGEEPTLDAYEATCEAAGDAEDRVAAAEAGQMACVYGPQEAVADDVIGAVERELLQDLEAGR